jgi:hypothetical protein
MARNRSGGGGGTVKAVVLVDRYAYHEDSGDPSSKALEADFAEGTTSAKGTEIEVSQEEFDRGSTMTPPALAKKGSKEAKRFLGQLGEDLPDRDFAALSDDDLKAIVAARGGNPDEMNRDELIGFVTGEPGNPLSNPAA